MNELPTSTDSLQPKSRTTRWFLRCLLGIGILLLCLPFAVRTWALWNLPAVPHPFDIEEYLAHKVSENENAASVYAHAESLRVAATSEEEKLIETVFAGEGNAWREAIAGLEDYLAQNEASLEVWKRATRDRYHVPVPLKDRHLLSGSDVRVVDWLNRNAALKSYQLDLQGKPEESREWILGMCRSSHQLGRRGSVLDRLWGSREYFAACQRLERWSAQRGLSGHLLKETLGELEELRNAAPDNSEVLRGEYILALNTLNIIDRAESAHSIEKLAGQNDINPTIFRAGCWMIGEPEQTRRLTAFFFYNQLGAVDRPLDQRPPRVGATGLFDDPELMTYGDLTLTAEEFAENYEQFGGVFSRITIGGVDLLTEASDEIELCHQAIRIVLAGQAFRRERGMFPEALDRLVPDYLPEVPIDPFDGKPIKYREDAEHPIVYSVYLNQVDDGGAEHEYESHSGDHPLDLGFRMLSERVRILNSR